VVKRIDYDSFGNILADTAPGFTVPLGFAGGLHDRDTGLVRFGFRDYDPDIGRWTSKDPIGFFSGDSDLYGYVFNDPIWKSDPLGLEVILDSTSAEGLGIPLSDLAPSEKLLTDTAQTAAIFIAASASMQNPLGVIVFTSVAVAAIGTKIALYSDTPCNDVIKEGLKLAIPAPPGANPVTDEIIDQTFDNYIEKYDLPKM
jgi:RHS repeat-associated protein